MINLLPHETREMLVFARRNTFLRRSVIGLAVGLSILAAVIAGSYFILQQQVNSLEASIKETEASLKEQNETETLNRVKEISDSLTLVVDVLGDQVLFSKLLPQVGAAMPSGTVLLNLSISNELKGAIDLKAGASSHDHASQVQINLEDPNNSIFEKADIVSIECNDPDPRYPCVVDLRAQFGEDTEFKLLSGTGGSNE